MHAGLDRQAGTGSEGTHARWSPRHYAHCVCPTGAGIHALPAGDIPPVLHGKMFVLRICVEEFMAD